MNLIRIDVQIRCEAEQAESLIGKVDHVEYGADTGIARLHITTTSTDHLLADTHKAVERIEELLGAGGMSYDDGLEISIGTDNRLIAETEAVLGATATAEDFAASMERVHRAVGFTPEQMAALATIIEDSIPPTRRQRLARRLRPFNVFCERLGAATLALPEAGPAFAHEFWRELRSGDPLAWAALAKAFAVGMLLLSVGLLASAASD